MYKHLTSYPTPHGTQMRLTGRNHLTAKAVYGSMLANNWTALQTSVNHNLPIEAVAECIRYCLDNEAWVARRVARATVQREAK